MENFTPIASLIGGALIGLAAVGMLLFTGRISGVSGIYGGLLTADKGDSAWRAWFIGGLMAGAVVMSFLRPESLDITVQRSELAIIVAGLLVGVGARLGSGCTSGHGVCGIGRLAPRSLVAAAVFMTTGAIASIVVNNVFGGVV
jgi:uncharacterized membrane protein YedE/YeeE